MKKDKREYLKYILIIAICAAIYFILPIKSVTSKYMMKVLDEALLFFVAVSGLTVVLGMGGQVTFSTAGIMGIGAYVTAVLTTRFSMDPLLSVLISMVIGGVFSFVMGLALFRLKGSYFAFASIGLTSLLYTLFSNWTEMTGGQNGITSIPHLNLYFFQCKTYYDYFRVYFIVALVCFLIVDRIRKTYLGRALASVRDDEITARSVGINPYMTKVYGFVIAGVLACLAGGMYALLERYISPEPFKYDQSAVYLIMVMLGGVESTFGALLGTVILTLIPEQLRFLQSYYKLIYGAGVILLMIVMPMGLTGLFNSLKYKSRGFFKGKLAKKEGGTKQ